VVTKSKENKTARAESCRQRSPCRLSVSARHLIRFLCAVSPAGRLPVFSCLCVESTSAGLQLPARHQLLTRGACRSLVRSFRFITFITAPDHRLLIRSS
jgi:hypothetical protein